MCHLIGLESHVTGQRKRQAFRRINTICNLFGNLNIVMLINHFINQKSRYTTKTFLLFKRKGSPFITKVNLTVLIETTLNMYFIIIMKLTSPNYGVCM